MLFYTVNQIYAVPAMIVCGLALGAWYDVLRAARRATGAGAALTALFDALFGAGAAAILVFFLYFVARLEFRLYLIVLAALGWALYAQTVTPLLRKIRQLFLKFCRNVRKCGNLQKIFNFFFR